MSFSVLFFLKPRLIEHVFYSLAAYLGKTFPKPSGFSLTTYPQRGAGLRTMSLGCSVKLFSLGFASLSAAGRFRRPLHLPRAVWIFDCSRVIITFAVSALGRVCTPTGLCRAVKACLPLKGPAVACCPVIGQARLPHSALDTPAR